MVKKEITIFTRFISNAKQFTNIMKMPLTSFRKIHDQTGRLNKTMAKNQTVMGRFAFGLRRATHGMRGFKMEMLGVMFFGMGIQRFFTGLLTPALKMAGIFDLLNVILGVVFLPIVLALLDPLLKVADFLFNMSDKTKLLIGKIVLWGAVIGGALFIIGMFALGIGSLIIAFGSLLGIVEKLIPGKLGEVAAAFLGINVAMLGGTFVIGIWNAIKSAVSGVWDRLKESPAIQGLLDKLGISMEALSNPWDTIKKEIKDTFDELVKQLGIEDEIQDFKDSFLDIKETFLGIAEAIEGIDFKEMADSIKTLTDELIPLIPPLTDLVTLLLKIVSLPFKVWAWFTGGVNDLAEEISARRTTNNLPLPPEGLDPTLGGLIGLPGGTVTIVIENNTDATIRVASEGGTLG